MAKEFEILGRTEADDGTLIKFFDPPKDAGINRQFIVLRIFEGNGGVDMNHFITKETIDNMFTYHSPKPDQPERYEKIRNAARELAHLINEMAPDSDEKTIAIHKLEEAVFYTNAAIARHE